MPLFLTLATCGFLNSFDSCHVTDWRQPEGKLCLHDLLDFHGWWALALQALAPGAVLVFQHSFSQFSRRGASYQLLVFLLLAMTPLRWR